MPTHNLTVQTGATYNCAQTDGRVQCAVPPLIPQAPQVNVKGGRRRQTYRLCPRNGKGDPWPFFAPDPWIKKGDRTRSCQGTQRTQHFHSPLKREEGWDLSY